MVFNAKVATLDFVIINKDSPYLKLGLCYEINNTIKAFLQ